MATDEGNPLDIAYLGAEVITNKDACEWNCPNQLVEKYARAKNSKRKVHHFAEEPCMTLHRSQAVRKQELSPFTLVQSKTTAIQ